MQVVIVGRQMILDPDHGQLVAPADPEFIASFICGTKRDSDPQAGACAAAARSALHVAEQPKNDYENHYGREASTAPFPGGDACEDTAQWSFHF